MEGQQYPPGWYQNPQGSGQRYWDGNRWTEHYQPGAQPPPPPPAQRQWQPPAQQFQPIQQKQGGGLWWKIALGIVLGGLVLIIGCSALLSAGLEEEQDENAITNAEYRTIRKGETRAALLDRLGEPESSDAFGEEGGEIRSDCLYWNLGEEDVGSFAQLCFDTRNRLESKSRYAF